uniref:Uncharacterized protein n=1 Tax=Nelumbo nucifera TaxID=4432 RepID=A0A822ZNV1_NELNU|nr:TPA_asm: hypothetical protein HUJ06_001698 [Nelumbo nucifera]
MLPLIQRKRQSQHPFSICWLQEETVIVLLSHPSPTVLIPALRTVGNIVTGDDAQTQFFRLPETAFLSNLMLTGQQFCEEDWSTLKKKYSSLSEDDLLRYCFSSSYIVARLHDTLGISLDDQRLMWMEMEQSIILNLLLQPCIGTS